MITEEFEASPEENISEQYKISQKKIKRGLYFIAGTICLILGIIGIAIPIFPTTPFLLLAAACYFRSSQKAYSWLLRNKLFGNLIKNYREGKGLPIRVRVITIALLWTTIVISIIFVDIIFVQILLVVIAILVSIHVALIRPKNKLKMRQ